MIVTKHAKLCLHQSMALELVTELEKLQVELSKRPGLKLVHSKLPEDTKQRMEALLRSERKSDIEPGTVIAEQWLAKSSFLGSQRRIYRKGQWHAS